MPELPVDVIPEVMHSGVVLGKENGTDSDWLFLVFLFGFMGNLL